MQHRLVLERGRIRHVNDDTSTTMSAPAIAGCRLQGAVMTRPTVNSGLISTTYAGGPHARTSANGLIP
jgi:hypothetical protein